MPKIILISTIHEEIGECTADELSKIIEKINPDVVFLEALKDTYTNYEEYIFQTYGVYHKKLEINALQRYSTKNSFEYIPVLDITLGEPFNLKYGIVCKNLEYVSLVEKCRNLTKTRGFSFLNSQENIKIHEQLRSFEKQILKNDDLDKIVDQSINQYENSMINNIKIYCSNSLFETGIFMCGAAHRKSIIEKIEASDSEIKWEVYGD